jgi:hypothetical protein
MEAGDTQSVRLRLNISTTSKGFYSWDHTAEVIFTGPLAAPWQERLRELSESLESYAQDTYGPKQDKKGGV